MIKQNKSRFEVRSSHLVAPHIWVEHPIARRGTSSASHIHDQFFTTNKYRIINTNHTFYEDNHTYKVNYFTIDDGTKVNHSADYLTNDHNCTGGINNGYAKHSEKVAYRNHKSLGGAGAYADKHSLINDVDDNHAITDSRDDPEAAEEEGDDNFTFSTSAADSKEFFQFMNTSPAAASAEAAGDFMSIMSPADELFEGGKIRPLMPPIIDGYGQLNFSNHPLHDLRPKSCISAASEALNRLIPSNHETNHRLISCSSEINQDLEKKRIISDQMGDPATDHHDHLPCKFTSLSAPASPLINEINNPNEKQYMITRIHSKISTNHQVINFKRCRSLSRAFHIEDTIERSTSDKKPSQKGGKNKKRTTLLDFLNQEASHTSTLKQEQQQEKLGSTRNMIDSYEEIMIDEGLVKSKQEQLGLISPNRNVINSYRTSLVPSPFNVPQLLPTTRENISVTNKKKVVLPSSHGVQYYTFHKAQAERMKRKTFLPYRPSLLGCLGYSPP